MAVDRAASPSGPTLARGPGGDGHAGASPNWDVGWVVAALLSLAAYAAGRWALPALNIRPGSSLRFFALAKTALAPEPLEQQRYGLTVLATGLVPLCLTGLLWRSRRPLPHRLLATLALAAQAGLVAIVVYSLYHDRLQVARAFPLYAGRGVVSVLVVGVALVFLGWRGRRALAAADRIGGGRVGDLVGMVLAVALGLALSSAGFYTDGSLLPGVPVQTYGHFPFTFEEAYSVALGRTPLVDFTPQYTALLPWLLAPVLSLRPPSVGAFTAAMTAASTFAFASLYVMLRLTTRRAGRALLLFAGAAAVGAAPPIVLPGGQVHSLTAYFAMMPMRYGPVLVTGLAMTWAVLNPSARWRSGLAGVVAGASVLANFEFGIFAFAGTFTVLALCRAPQERWRPVAALRALAPPVAGAVAFWVVFALATLGRSGELPHISDLVYFNRQFAQAGFFLLPLPGLFGLHTVVYLVSAAALILGVAQALLGLARPAAEGRLGCALLIYAGMVGIGSFTYFTGRSHPDVVFATLLGSGIALVALTWEALRRLQTASAPWRAAPVAGLTVVLGVLAAVGGLARLNYVPAEVKRISTLGQQPRILAQLDPTDLARNCLPRGTDTLILTQMPDRVAYQARIRNWYPYNDSGSMVTFQQLDRTLAAARDHHVRIAITTVIAPEVETGLRRAGFERLVRAPTTHAVPGVAAAPETDLWERQGGPPVSTCRPGSG